MLSVPSSAPEQHLVCTFPERTISILGRSSTCNAYSGRKNSPIPFGLSQDLGSCYGKHADSEIVAGAVVQGFTGDWLGRVKALQIGAVISIIGTAVVAGSVNIPQLFVFRFITGLGVGQLLALVPLYITEVAPPHRRGLLSALTGCSFSLGYLR